MPSAHADWLDFIFAARASRHEHENGHDALSRAGHMAGNDIFSAARASIRLYPQLSPAQYRSRRIYRPRRYIEHATLVARWAVRRFRKPVGFRPGHFKPYHGACRPRRHSSRRCAWRRRPTLCLFVALGMHIAFAEAHTCDSLRHQY